MGFEASGEEVPEGFAGVTAGQVEDRMRDEAAWREQTFPTAPGSIPPIITPEQFHRVQDQLAQVAALKNRGGLPSLRP